MEPSAAAPWLDLLRISVGAEVAATIYCWIIFDLPKPKSSILHLDFLSLPIVESLFFVRGQMSREKVAENDLSPVMILADELNAELTFVGADVRDLA
jgi:hypothetical protein